MSPAHVAIDALLFVAVAIALVCTVGIFVLRGAIVRLHALGPVTMLCPWLVAAAIVLSKISYDGAGFKAAFIALVMATFGPVLTHLLGRTVVDRGAS